MLVVIVTRSQVVRLKSIVSEIDPDAFVYATSVSEALGKGFNPMKKIKKANISDLPKPEQENLQSLSLEKKQDQQTPEKNTRE